MQLCSLLLLLVVLLKCAAVTTSTDQLPRVNFEVEEESPLHYVVGVLPEQNILKRLFVGAPNSRKLTFEQLGQNAYFGLDRVTGRLRVASIIDREGLCDNHVRTCCVTPGGPEQCTIKLTVLVVDSAAKNAFGGTRILEVAVRVLDRNDNPPRFIKTQYRFTIPEDAPVGHTQTLPAAKDVDSTKFDINRYEMVSCGGTATPVDTTFELHQEFAVDGSNKIDLRLSRRLDRESQSSYTYCVVAVDKGIPSKSGTLTVHVDVADRNDHSPTWVQDQQFELAVSEDTEPFTNLPLRLQASDKDSLFGHLRYSIDPRDTDSTNAKYFVINANDGTLQLQRFLDYETRQRYLIPVIVEDNGQRSATATITVNVLDRNDEKPQIKFRHNFQVSGLAQYMYPEQRDSIFQWVTVLFKG